MEMFAPVEVNIEPGDAIFIPEPSEGSTFCKNVVWLMRF
jgi:hypothetical protein